MIKVADLWQSYAARVLPPDAPPVQRQETRRAFYAGAGAVLSGVLLGLVESPGPAEADTEADTQAINELLEELDAFARDVAAGKT